MLRLQLRCVCCEKPLDGGLDTFGNPGAEMCYECWSGITSGILVLWDLIFEIPHECYHCGEFALYSREPDLRPERVFCAHCGQVYRAGEPHYKWLWFE